MQGQSGPSDKVAEAKAMDKNFLKGKTIFIVYSKDILSITYITTSDKEEDFEDRD